MPEAAIPAIIGGVGAAAGPSIAKLIQTPTPFGGELQGIAGYDIGQANQQQAYGQQLEQPLATGVLPTPQAAEVDAALQAAKASSASQFAKLGLGNSTMAQSAQADAVQESAVTQAKIESDLATVGQQAIKDALAGETGAANIYQNLAQTQVNQDLALSNAIGNFGKAVGASYATPGAGTGVGTPGYGQPLVGPETSIATAANPYNYLTGQYGTGTGPTTLTS